MHTSQVIEISGQFAGAALHQGDGFRFVAVDPRVKELDRSLWSSLPEMRRVVRHLLITEGATGQRTKQSRAEGRPKPRALADLAAIQQPPRR